MRKMSLKNTAFSVAWRALSERMKKSRWEGQISEGFEQQVSKFLEDDVQIILSNRKKNEPQHDHTFPAEPANCWLVF